MHEIRNTNRTTPRTFPTANGHVTLKPGEKRTFNPGTIGAGMLKIMQNASSDLKLANTSDEATKLAQEAAARVKKKGFAIVHGSGDRSVEDTLRAERRGVGPIRQIEDRFGKAQAKTQANLAGVPDDKKRVNLNDPAEELEKHDEQDDDGNDGLGKSEPTDKDTSEQPETEQQKSTRLKLQQPSPLADLIKQVDDETISMKELRAQAKTLLGDDYPGGQLSKDDIVTALKKAMKKKD